MGVGQGRQLKICTSVLLIFFLVYITYFAEEEIKYLEKEYQIYMEERTTKQLLKSSAIKTYNYNYLLTLQEYVQKIKDQKYYALHKFEKITDLPENEKQALLYFAQENQWQKISTIIFNLIDEDQDLNLSSYEYTNFINTLLNFNSNYLEKLQNLYDTQKIGTTPSSFQFTMQELQQQIQQKLQKNNLRNLSNKKQNSQNLLNLFEQGIKLYINQAKNKETENLNYQQYEFFTKQGNYQHWKILAEGIFKLMDSDNDNFINESEINQFLKEINTEKSAEQWLHDELLKLDKNLDNSNTNNEDIKIDIDEFDSFSERIYQLHMDYHGNSLENQEQFSTYYYNKEKIDIQNNDN